MLLFLNRQGDYEGYVCSLLIQNPVTRRFVIALRTLNLELSLVRDQAKSNATAELRFAFWRQCIDRSFERDHSVLGTSESVGRELNQVSESRFTLIAIGFVDFTLVATVFATN